MPNNHAATTEARKAECIRASHRATRKMWMDRREREDAEGKPGRIVQLRRDAEDRIMRGWAEIDASGILRLEEGI